MSVKPAHRLMQNPMSVDAKRYFQIIGYVSHAIKDVEETKITLAHVNQAKYENNISYYKILFLPGPAKVFIDRNAHLEDLVICIGEIMIAGNGSLYLQGDYAMVFRGEVGIFDDPPPAYIDLSEIDDLDNTAF